MTQLLERERLGTRIEERPPEVMPLRQRFTVLGVSLIAAAVLFALALGIWLAVALLSDADVAVPSFFSEAREGQIELRTEIVEAAPGALPVYPGQSWFAEVREGQIEVRQQVAAATPIAEPVYQSWVRLREFGPEAAPDLAWALRQYAPEGYESWLSDSATGVAPVGVDLAWALRQYAPEGYDWWLSDSAPAI